jgi:RHH-type rel operon transcriptional repressor/antitoxin RelB
MATSIELDPDIERRLDKLAAATGRPKELYLGELIESGMEDLEDYYEAAAVLERVKSGDEDVHSLHAVRRDLALDD